jgi:hypothetical protein
MAVRDELALRVELGEPRGNLVERDQPAAFDVHVGVLAGLADVEQERRARAFRRAARSSA